MPEVFPEPAVDLPWGHPDSFPFSLYCFGLTDGVTEVSHLTKGLCPAHQVFLERDVALVFRLDVSVDAVANRLQCFAALVLAFAVDRFDFPKRITGCVQRFLNDFPVRGS